MSLFKKSNQQYSVANFERHGDPTGMRAEFLKASEKASKKADPTGMRAEFMEAATKKKGGKRTKKLNTRRKKNRSSKRKN